jgi:hypothetical protein
MNNQLISALPPVVAECTAAVNAFDNDRILATLAPDAYVNDDRREIWGIEAIRKFIAKEIADALTGRGGEPRLGSRPALLRVRLGRYLVQIDAKELVRIWHAVILSIGLRN